jgi:hypothetical protein
VIWKKHQAHREGKCYVNLNGEGIIARFEMGIIETGRQRVYAGNYIKAIGPDGEEWLGEDASSMLKALRALDEDIERDRGRLLCAGLLDGFHESGLSVDTGYGYIDGYPRAVHMMERPRLPALNEAAAPANAATDAGEALASMRERSRDKL